MTSCPIQRRIMHILQTQNEICAALKHVTKQYTMKHSYRTDDALNIPSTWVKIMYLINSTELREFCEDDIISAVNALTEKLNVSLHVDGKHIRYKKD